jgi:hypothetical protein
MDARYEGPTLSRFLSEDPNFIAAGAPDWVTGMPSDPKYAGLTGLVNSSNVNYLANPQNLNPYSYVDNNPLRYVDPTGKFTIDLSLNYVADLGAQLGLGGAIGARVELWPNLGFQTYYSGSLGVGGGATFQARIYPYGTLDPQGQYDSVEAVFARGYGGAASRDAVVAGQRPINALINSGDTSIGFAAGAQTSVTYSRINLGKPRYLVNWTPATAGTPYRSTGGGGSGTVQYVPRPRGGAPLFYVGGAGTALSSPATNGLPPPPAPPPPPSYGFRH